MASTTVQSMEDVMALLATGERNRSVGCTNMNEHSSRSHMILSIHSCGTNCVTGVKVHILKSTKALFSIKRALYSIQRAYTHMRTQNM